MVNLPWLPIFGYSVNSGIASIYGTVDYTVCHGGCTTQYMNNKKSDNLAKKVYQHLRSQSWDVLWLQEVPLFDAGTAEYRLAQVGLVRAIAVVALERATQAQRVQARQWLMKLLADPQAKVRRYAVVALPKLGGSLESEAALLALLDQPQPATELNYLSRSLEKIGGEPTLEKLQQLEQADGALKQTEQKIKAQLARREPSARVLLNVKIRHTRGLRIHLRTRRGLETLLRDEFLAHPSLNQRFDLVRVSPACVALSARGPFSLGQLYQLRTFASINLVLGSVAASVDNQATAMAQLIASKQTQQLCGKLTDGQARYRLDFIRQKLPAGTVQDVVNQAFALCPTLLNDARQAPWAIEIYPEKIGRSIELRPRVSPDPRFQYRVDDVPAATHQPLAAAMAQIAGVVPDEMLWDPFCGSGSELMERARLGPVQMMIASDSDETAIQVLRKNFAAVATTAESVAIHCCNFRHYKKQTEIAANSLSLILSNPPLGRRVRVTDLPGLINDLYRIAAETLRPGGRLVFINPLKLESPDPSLQLAARYLVDLGGFNCRVEKWVKL